MRFGRRLLGLCAAAGVAVAICAPGSGASTGQTFKIPVGGGQYVTVHKGPVKIALFLPGSGNTWLINAIDQAKKEAAISGAQVTTFIGGDFVESTEYAQIQDAITSGKYNGIVVLWAYGAQTCHLLTQSAPSAGILVSTIDFPICGLFAKEGNAQVPPGVLNYVGGTYEVSTMAAWLNRLAQINTGPQQVVVFNGPAVNPLTINTKTALTAFLPHHSNWSIVGQEYTDYSITKGFTDAQNVLQAHPGVTLILSPESDVTTGIIRALKAAGKIGKVKVAELGGNSQSIAEIKSGELEMTVAQYPRSEIMASVASIVNAIEHGRVGPRFLQNAGHPLDAGQKPGAPELVTKANVNTYTPDW
jgi:ABC-type sugar transport system substrate-binding protein